MKRILSLLICLVLVLYTFVGCSNNKKENNVNFEMMTVIPKIDNTPLINPGKGWIVYDSPVGSFENAADASWELATVGYCRFSWSDIEIADGVYDWTIIDNAIEQCKNEGKTLAFGVMSCNPTSVDDYCTPKFILDMPDVNELTLVVPNHSRPTGDGGYEMLVKHIVDFSDPGEGYYRKSAELTQAIRERYGDNPYIEYIDIRNFGSWGENTHGWLYGDGNDGYDKGICDDSRHDQGINYDVVKRCWQIYIDAFADTDIQLMTAWGYGCGGCANYTAKELFYWAAEQGVGVRRDGFSTWDQCKGAECLWSVNLAASALEMPGGYLPQRDTYGFTAEDLFESIEYNRVSYYPIGAYGSDGTAMVNDLSDAMWSSTNRMGYHFVLNKASYSSSMGIGEDGVIYMEWLNDGVAKLFLASHVELALLDENGNVVDRCVLEGVDPTSFVSEVDILTNDKANRVVSKFRFNNVEENQNYKLAIGVFTDRANSENPDILIGNGGKTDNNWYVLSDDAEKENVISMKASVTASSSVDGCDAQSALMQVNGYWTAVETDSEPWMLIDLGKVTSFSSLNLVFGRQISKSFTVAVSNNKNGEFETVYRADNNEKECITCEFPTQKARYIKVTFEDNVRQAANSSSFVPEIGSNLIQNGDFEKGMRLWTCSGQPCQVDPITQSGNTVLLNNKCLELKQNLLQNFELTGPGRYCVTFRAYVPNDNRCFLQAVLQVKGSEDDQTNVQWWAPTSTDAKGIDIKYAGWNTYSVEIDAEYAGMAEMALFTLRLSDGREIYVDDISFVKVSDICGERSEKCSPVEGSITVRSLSVN